MSPPASVQVMTARSGTAGGMGWASKVAAAETDKVEVWCRCHDVSDDDVGVGVSTGPL